mmetsp:Transcript_73340/g.138602  ORF Transcript_73340/g.138602 Transcript_73340/m.138602 type:complete len:205 (+) Transcript_73340:128-742(+)
MALRRRKPAVSLAACCSVAVAVVGLLTRRRQVKMETERMQMLRNQRTNICLSSGMVMSLAMLQMPMVASAMLRSISKMAILTSEKTGKTRAFQHQGMKTEWKIKITTMSLLGTKSPRMRTPSWVARVRPLLKAQPCRELGDGGGDTTLRRELSMRCRIQAGSCLAKPAGNPQVNKQIIPSRLTAEIAGLLTLGQLQALTSHTSA